jgi:hypothetical protein
MPNAIVSVPYCSTAIYDLAVEFDESYRVRYGSYNAASSSASAYINAVNAIYLNQLNISWRLTNISYRFGAGLRQSIIRESQLSEAASWWNCCSQVVDRDAVLVLTTLWDGRQIHGISYGSSICFKTGAYAVVNTDWANSYSSGVNVISHELGHILGASHCDGVPGCSIMCSSPSASCGSAITSSSATFDSYAQNAIRIVTSGRYCQWYDNRRADRLVYNPIFDYNGVRILDGQDASLPPRSCSGDTIAWRTVPGAQNYRVLYEDANGNLVSLGRVAAQPTGVQSFVDTSTGGSTSSRVYHVIADVPCTLFNSSAYQWLEYAYYGRTGLPRLLPIPSVPPSGLQSFYEPESSRWVLRFLRAPQSPPLPGSSPTPVMSYQVQVSYQGYLNGNSIFTSATTVPFTMSTGNPDIIPTIPRVSLEISSLPPANFDGDLPNDFVFWPVFQVRELGVCSQASSWVSIDGYAEPSISNNITEFVVPKGGSVTLNPGLYPGTLGGVTILWVHSIPFPNQYSNPSITLGGCSQPTSYGPVAPCVFQSGETLTTWRVLVPTRTVTLSNPGALRIDNAQGDAAGDYTVSYTYTTGGPISQNRVISSNVLLLRVQCSPADVAGAGQSIGPDNELTADDWIVFVNWARAGDMRADIAGPGQSSTRDGIISADDYIRFNNLFLAGCP